jgi:hypothetical protein
MPSEISDARDVIVTPCIESLQGRLRRLTPRRRMRNGGFRQLETTEAVPAVPHRPAVRSAAQSLPASSILRRGLQQGYKPPLIPLPLASAERRCIPRSRRPLVVAESNRS